MMLKSNTHISCLLLFIALTYSSLTGAQSLPKIDTANAVTMRGTFYSDRFVGRKTSSGEVFTQKAYTAAHHTYKFGTLLLVTNPVSGKQVIVRINDRCPKSNILDMARKAADAIDVKSRIVKVHVLPEDYKQVWESQELYSDLLEGGVFLDYVNSGGKLRTKGNVDTLRYNIELFRCATTEAAREKLSKLPIYYHDNIVYRNDSSSKQVTAILEIYASKSKALEVSKELKAMFPRLKIVKTE